MVVVPTGRLTKAGKPIFKAAPTKSSIKRKVSEKRVQRFSGGKKISDTQRVQLPSGEFVTIASAKALSKAGSKVFIEAQQKEAEIQRLTQEAIKQAGFDIEKITARGENQRTKVAKLIIAEQRARGTEAEALFRQRRIEEQDKLGKLERGAAVLVQFTTAGGRAVAQVQVKPKKVFRRDKITPPTEAKKIRDTLLEPEEDRELSLFGGLIEFTPPRLRTITGDFPTTAEEFAQSLFTKQTQFPKFKLDISLLKEPFDIKKQAKVKPTTAEQFAQSLITKQRQLPKLEFAEEVFDIKKQAKVKPTTAEQFAQSLFTKQRQFPKLEFAEDIFDIKDLAKVKPTTAEEFAQSLITKQKQLQKPPLATDIFDIKDLAKVSPTTAEEFAQSLITKQKQLPKLEFAEDIFDIKDLAKVKPTTAEEFAQSLFTKQKQLPKPKIDISLIEEPFDIKERARVKPTTAEQFQQFLFTKQTQFPKIELDVSLLEEPFDIKQDINITQQLIEPTAKLKLRLATDIFDIKDLAKVFPTTSEEFAQSLITKQRQLPKLEFAKEIFDIKDLAKVKPTTAEEFAQFLITKQKQLPKPPLATEIFDIKEQVKVIPTTSKEFQRFLFGKQKQFPKIEIDVSLAKKPFVISEEPRRVLTKPRIEVFPKVLAEITAEDIKEAFRVSPDFPILFGARVATPRQLLGEPIKAGEFLETKISPLTTRIFRTKELGQQQKSLRTEINKLEGKTDRASVIQRRLLKGELASISIEIGVRKQFGEQPLQTLLLFGGGALFQKGVLATSLIGKPIFKVGTGVLGAVFVGGTALESRLAFEEGGIEEAFGVVGERLAETTAFIGGGTFAARFGVEPKRVKVLKAKEPKGQFAEVLETEGTSAISLERLGLKTDVRTRVARFQRGGQVRQLKTPKDPVKLAKLLEDQNVRFEFRIIDGVAKQVLVRDIPPTTVRPKLKPEPFEILIKDGKIATRVSTQFGDIEVIRDIKDVKLDLKRIIDPTTFKRISGKKGLTILQRDVTFDIDKLSFDFRAEIGGRARITGKVKKVKLPSDIFGLGTQLLPPETVFIPTKPTTTKLPFRPILAVAPIFESPQPIVFPTSLFGDLFRETKRRVRKPIFDITPDIDVRTDIARISGIESISESISKRDVISDIQQIAEQQREGKRILESIVDVDLGLGEVQVSIIDVAQKIKQRQDVALRTDLITEQVKKQKPTQDIGLLLGFPIPKKKKQIKKGKFEGYNAFVKGRKGKQLKVNLRRTLTKKSALSSSARVVDNSIAATGSIKKVETTIPPLDTKDKYFQRNRDKFRTFRIRKGKRIPLKDKFIEKRGKRLDTRGEVLQITAAKKIAEQRKRLAKLDVFGTSRKKKQPRTVRFF